MLKHRLMTKVLLSHVLWSGKTRPHLSYVVVIIIIIIIIPTFVLLSQFLGSLGNRVPRVKKIIIIIIIDLYNTIRS